MKKIITLLLFIVGLQFVCSAEQAWNVNEKNDNATIEYSIYPNPANSNFTITYNYTPNTYVEIYDVLGTMVTRLDFTQGTDNVYVDCSEWKKGYYFCKFISQNKVQTAVRLIIQR